MPKLSRNSQTAKLLEKGIAQAEILLVEFKAPKELVEAFDSKLRTRFSSRSEAIRSLIRAFLSERSERS